MIDNENSKIIKTQNDDINFYKNKKFILESAKVHDAVGIRIVCNFIDDVYNIISMLKEMSDIKVIK